MRPAEGAAASEIADNPLLLPIAITGRLRSVPSTQLYRGAGLGVCAGAPFRRLRQRPLCGVRQFAVLPRVERIGPGLVVGAIFHIFSLNKGLGQVFGATLTES